MSVFFLASCFFQQQGWRVKSVIGRGNAGWTMSKNEHPRLCQNCSQWLSSGKAGRWSWLNRPLCPPTVLPVKGLNWTDCETICGNLVILELDGAVPHSSRLGHLCSCACSVADNCENWGIWEGDQRSEDSSTVGIWNQNPAAIFHQVLKSLSHLSYNTVNILY